MIATVSLPPSTRPLTLDAAVERLIENMTDEEKSLVRGTAENRLSGFHFPWGMWIRNEFGMWSGNTQLLESCSKTHPDDASRVIIRAVWERLRQTQS